MEGFGELLIIQAVYIIILSLIIRSTIRQRKRGIVHWIIAALYLLTIIWLTIEFIRMPKFGNGGYGFAIGMYSMIVPGFLTLISIFVFIASQVSHKSH